MVDFNKEKHEYTNKKGEVLISCTQLLDKYGLSPDYGVIKADTLNKYAERGNLIHEEINAFLTSGKEGFTEELALFKKFVDENKQIKAFDSEYIVDNNIVAGTIDLIYYTEREDGLTQAYICDIKTTSVIHHNAVSWQLSVYNYLMFPYNYENSIAKVFHFHNGELNIVDVNLKPKAEVKRLIDCYVNNKPFMETNYIPKELTRELSVVEESIIAFERYITEQKRKKEEIVSKIIKTMEDNGVKTVETDNIKITYIAPSKRKTLDSKKLQEKLPSVYNDFVRETETKASLRITVKGKKENE